MRSLFRLAIAFLAIGGAVSSANAQDIRIAHIEGLSGPFANVGDHWLSEFRFAADRVNSQGGVLNGRKLSVIPFDNKGSPQESLIQLRNAINQGVRFILHGNSSAVASALVDAIDKHNARSPDAQVMYLNYSAIDTPLTNERCSFWHFRFDAHVDMKINALVSALSTDSKIKKVYLINQDYSFGHTVSKSAIAALKDKRPDIEVVGNDFHPIGQVRDFLPYVAKIQASGAQAVITANWGNDVLNLIKAGNASGLDVSWYTFYAGAFGAPTALGDGAAGRVRLVSEYHNNVKNNGIADWDAAYRTRAGSDFLFQRGRLAVLMLAEAINKAKSTEAKDVARALEGMRFEGGLGTVEMRAGDHQLLQPLFVYALEKTAARGGPSDAVIELEGSGLGPVTVERFEAARTALPHTCAMKRPN